MTRAALRSVSVVFCALTAAYALLCASPFTYHDFIRSNMFSVASFAMWHARLYWIWLVAAVLDVRVAADRRLRAWLPFAVVWFAVGVYVSVRPVLPALADDQRSLVVAVAALVPLLWLAAADYLGNRVVWSGSRDAMAGAHADATEGRLLIAAEGSAIFLAVASAVLVPLLMRGQFEPDLLSTGLTVGLAWTLAAASVISCGMFLTVAAIMRAVRFAPVAVQYAIVAAIATLGAAVGIDRAVCQTLGFVGFWRIVVSIAAGAGVVATWGAQQVRRFSAVGGQRSSPLDLLIGTRPGPVAAFAAVWPLGAILVAMYFAALVTRLVDWDFLMLMTAIALLWTATFVHLFRIAPARVFTGPVVSVVCLLPLALWLIASSPGIARPAIRHTLDRYTVYSGSLRLVESVLQRSTSRGVTPFQRYLRENTALSNTDIKPIDLQFVSPLVAAPRQPPHVFLFVIDSLRPDYLSPYNAAVTFTPRIAQFAAESVVFRNAMTRYGATGLSLPAIWAGAVGVHRQYVMPFAPMNTLEKLLIVNRYRRVLSLDVLMQRLLLPWPDTTYLDQGRRTLDYDLCATLGELEARFPDGAPTDPPVFGYSNPQNLHLSNLATASVPEGERYDGFHAPYAMRVHAVDGCFGAFVDFLKARRLYDRSVIVLTSDHGELLGEEGRWGHAYYLFPQILQIPLIVHLPASVASDDLDDRALSFSTDVAPTVYAALGYQPRPANHLMGESLVGPTKLDTAARRRGDYVVEASYSAVYGVVRKNGRRVYIIDAVSGTEYAYERSRQEGWQATRVVDAIRVPAQRLIREHLDALRRTYHLPPLQ